MTLKEKIKDQYGTMRHFCRKNNVSYNSVKQVLVGNQKSQPVVDALLAKGFITEITDLPQYALHPVDRRFKANQK